MFKETPPQSPLPVTETPSASKSSGFLKTFFIIIALILFGILIGVLAARFLPMSQPEAPLPTPTIEVTPSTTPTPTIDETEGWTTYTNAAENYSIKYPPEATLSAATKPSVSIVFIGQTQMKSGRTQTELSDGYKINISYEFLAPKQTLLSSVTSIHQQAGASCPSPEKVVITPLSETSISGIPAMMFSVKNCFADYTEYFFEKSGKLFTLTSMYPAFTPEQQLIYQKDADKIISTFKFTANTSSGYTCPANGWVDCMPILDAAKQKACSTEAMAWYKANCPNFQGAAL